MEESCDRRRMAHADRVTIRLNDDGTLEIEPYWAIFYKGQDLVIAYVTDAPWAVGFHGKRTPTDALVIHGNGSHMDRPHEALKRGHYPYTVAVVGQNDAFLRDYPTVFLDAACPEIIIE